MAPFHLLRHQVRALTARAGTAFAVFVTIAVVLLAGGANGPLASAEADDGDTGVGIVDQRPDPPPPTSQEQPALDPGPLDGGPVTTEPSAETLSAVEPTAGPSPEDQGPVDERVDGGSPTGEPVDGGPDEDNPTGGDDPSPPSDDGPSPAAERSPLLRAEGVDDGIGNTETSLRSSIAPPSGGSKIEEQWTESGTDPEPGPDLSSRPQTVSPPAGDESGADGSGSPDQASPATSIPVGSGFGALHDAGSGDLSPSEGRARFGTAAGTGGSGDRDSGAGGPAGDGGAAAGSTVAGDLDGALLASGDTPGTQSGDTADGEGGGGGGGGGENRGGGSQSAEPNPVTRTVNNLVEVVPDSLKAALAALAALSVLLAFGYLLAALRARRLARQRRELLQEVGLLQTALLPPVPEQLGTLRTSVAYRPADGPGAGGDFYDVLPLAGGRVGFILGDVSGHGRGALARTAFMRYTLRAYLEAGLEPRVALQVAGRVIDDNLGGDFATVLLAVHDPETGSLTYASAGHPAPIVVGPQPHDPVTAASSPPIGVGVRTGLRQTTVPLVSGSVACLFTDGLIEARTEDGVLGRERLTELLDEIRDEATAKRLLERVAAAANVRADDMAAVVVSPTDGVTAGQFRTEQLELSARELEGPVARRFLNACGFTPTEVDDTERDARLLADRFGGVVLHVVFGNRLRVEVLPRNVESIEAASRRVSAGTP